VKTFVIGSKLVSSLLYPSVLLSLPPLIRVEIFQHKKAFWRKPNLYHDGKIEFHPNEPSHINDDLVSHFKPHRGEIWYELFYDLIYVAAAGEIGKLAEHDATSWSLIKCGVIFAVVRDVCPPRVPSLSCSSLTHSASLSLSP
jgi:hypothetical protein